MNRIPMGGPLRWSPALDALGASPAGGAGRVTRPADSGPAVPPAELPDRGHDDQGPPPERRGMRAPQGTGGAPDPTGNAGRRLDLFA